MPHWQGKTVAEIRKKDLKKAASDTREAMGVLEDWLKEERARLAVLESTYKSTVQFMCDINKRMFFDD